METRLLSDQEHHVHRAAQSLGELHGGIRRRNGSMGNPEDELREMQKFGVTAGPEEWSAVANLDIYFTSMYNYFNKRGLVAVIVGGVTDIITLGFTVFFSTFLFSWVDWGRLLECSDEESCRHLGHYLRNPLNSPSFIDILVIFWFLIFLVYWLWTIVSFLTQAREATEMHAIFKHRLGIGDRELQTIQWHQVVSRLEEEQKSGRYRIAISSATSETFTAKDVACRIMRKENYFIAMLNKGLLPLRLPVPRVPPFIRCLISDEDEDEQRPQSSTQRAAILNIDNKLTRPEAINSEMVLNSWWRLSRRSYLTKTLEWSINFCVLNQMLNEKFTVRQDFIDGVDVLQKRFVWIGCLHFVMMPFILVFMVIHFFLKHAQEWNHSKNYLGPRQWDNLALWHFREFNELPHIFEKRVARSYEHGSLFAKSQVFYNPVVSVLARCFAFISGSFVGVLLVLTLLDDAYLFHITLNNRNLLWYLGILSAVFAFSRALVYEASTDERIEVEDADEAMSKVAEHTHYFPEHWRGNCNTVEVRDEFLSIFKFKAQLFAEEIIAVLFAPFTLCCAMPAAADRILDFIRNHTEDVEGIGSVCGYSLFAFDRYGDGRFAAPMKKMKERLPDQSEQGKLEKSFLNFKINHPDWNCGEQGEQFISRLCEFQEQQVAARQEQQQEALLEMQLNHHSSQVLGRNSRAMNGIGPTSRAFDPIPEDTNAVNITVSSSGKTDIGKKSSANTSLHNETHVAAGLTEKSSHENSEGQNVFVSSIPPAQGVDGDNSRLLASSTMSGSLRLASQGINLFLGDALPGAGHNTSLGLSLAASNTLFEQSSVHPHRTVDSILQSALRESAQGASLRDVISRRGIYRGITTSSILDNHIDASFYWLDRFRGQANTDQSCSDSKESINTYSPPPPPPPTQTSPLHHFGAIGDEQSDENISV